jgi:hypothetical protein
MRTGAVAMRKEQALLVGDFTGHAASDIEVELGGLVIGSDLEILTRSLVDENGGC